MPAPPPFERDADEVAWVINTTLDVAARRGEAWRACSAKHQSVVEALQDCADKNTPTE